MIILVVWVSLLQLKGLKHLQLSVTNTIAYERQG